MELARSGKGRVIIDCYVEGSDYDIASSTANRREFLQGIGKVAREEGEMSVIQLYRGEKAENVALNDRSQDRLVVVKMSSKVGDAKEGGSRRVHSCHLRQ